MGVGGGNPSPPKRDRVKGWSAGAVRRHTAWLYGVDSPSLDGYGYALTLTLRDIPESAQHWQALRVAWEKRARRLPGFLRVHWVVEWTARGRPHLHAAVYFREPLELDGAQLVVAWVIVASRYGTALAAQHVASISGPLGWLQYLSKHAARGVAHYQRQGKPSGWESTGRLWGYGGQWPTDEPMRFDLDMPTYHRYRRLVRSWRIAGVRRDLASANDSKARAAARKRLVMARRMLACGSPRLSAVRGVSDWVPEDTTAAFVALLASEGRDVGQKS